MRNQDWKSQKEGKGKKTISGIKEGKKGKGENVSGESKIIKKRSSEPLSYQCRTFRHCFSHSLLAIVNMKKHYWTTPNIGNPMKLYN